MFLSHTSEKRKHAPINIIALLRPIALFLITLLAVIIMLFSSYATVSAIEPSGSPTPTPAPTPLPAIDTIERNQTQERNLQPVYTLIPPEGWHVFNMIYSAQDGVVILCEKDGEDTEQVISPCYVALYNNITNELDSDTQLIFPVEFRPPAGWRIISLQVDSIIMYAMCVNSQGEYVICTEYIQIKANTGADI